MRVMGTQPRTGIKVGERLLCAVFEYGEDSLKKFQIHRPPVARGSKTSEWHGIKQDA